MNNKTLDGLKSKDDNNSLIFFLNAAVKGLSVSHRIGTETSLKYLIKIETIQCLNRKLT